MTNGGNLEVHWQVINGSVMYLSGGRAHGGGGVNRQWIYLGSQEYQMFMIKKLPQCTGLDLVKVEAMELKGGGTFYVCSKF